MQEIQSARARSVGVHLELRRGQEPVAAVEETAAAAPAEEAASQGKEE